MEVGAAAYWGAAEAVSPANIEPARLAKKLRRSIVNISLFCHIRGRW
ncbi:hypothetical protein SBA3_1420001 [Candidatus Sulfopaludibacter sp. SbA3]|nr:hypothetical protein SBA3_1420001 [Candidatus Sulfopaludibacter sp. SbA3]